MKLNIAWNPGCELTSNENHTKCTNISITHCNPKLHRMSSSEPGSILNVIRFFSPLGHFRISRQIQNPQARIFYKILLSILAIKNIYSTRTCTYIYLAPLIAFVEK